MTTSSNLGGVDDDDDGTSFHWIVHGTIVLPTGNPFLTTTTASKDNETATTIDDDNQFELGPGLKLLLDHVVVVNQGGIIVIVEPAESFFNKYPQHRPTTTRATTTSSLDDDDVVKHRRQQQQAQDPDSSTTTYIRLEYPHEFLCPGFIDLHCHAPQYAFCGTATDRPLTGPQGWLETYTFPTERSLLGEVNNDDTRTTAAADGDDSGDDKNVVPRMMDHSAENIYTSVVQTTLALGTTTVVYWGTLDLAPTQILVDCCLSQGQRAYVGKVCMDRNAPENYCHSTEQNIQDTISLIQYIRNHPQQQRQQQPPTSITSSFQRSQLIIPIIMPRFIPTCTPALLDALGQLAQDYHCPVTSHISESVDEVAWSRQLDAMDHPEVYGVSSTDVNHHHHPPGRSDAAIFQAHGLLTDQCIMAHAVYLNDEDVTILKDCGSAIAHCPLSNFFFAGACMPCRQYLQQGVKIGLGTDVAGGPNPSMLDSQRHTVVASLSLVQQQQQQKLAQQQTMAAPTSTPPTEKTTPQVIEPLDYRHALYLATLGGAEALGRQDVIGTFRVGMEFDAIVLSSGARSQSQSHSTPLSSRPNIHIFHTDTVADVLQKILLRGDDRNVIRVFVQGQQVK